MVFGPFFNNERSCRSKCVLIQLPFISTDDLPPVADSLAIERDADLRNLLPLGEFVLDAAPQLFEG